MSTYFGSAAWESLTLQKPYITFWFSKWPESSCKPPSGGIRRHQDSHLLTLTPPRAWNPKERLHLWALQLPLPASSLPEFCDGVRKSGRQALALPLSPQGLIWGRTEEMLVLHTSS